jgi:hypothetical protein
MDSGCTCPYLQSLAGIELAVPPPEQEAKASSRGATLHEARAGEVGKSCLGIGVFATVGAMEDLRSRARRAKCVKVSSARVVISERWALGGPPNIGDVPMPSPLA